MTTTFKFTAYFAQVASSPMSIVRPPSPTKATKGDNLTVREGKRGSHGIRQPARHGRQVSRHGEGQPFGW
jgi:hypothetical protein